jgi:hypothetical protein
MPYSGADFSPTQPGTEQLYTLSFVTLLGIMLNETVTISGTPTAGDTIAITLINPNVPGGTQTVTYTVQGTDTLTTIAAAIAALINGSQQIASANFAASAAGPVCTITYPPTPATQMTQQVSPAQVGGTPTETVAFATAADSAETITAATWLCEVFQVLFGNADPSPSARIIGSASISGPQVSTLAGGVGGAGFVAGNNYRLTCTATTSAGQVLKSYSHVNCLLPA